MMQFLIFLVASSIFVSSATAQDCGHPKDFIDLVAGGKNVSAADWPWIGALFYQNLSKLEFKCGATLISPSIVVTAAHCVIDGQYNVYFEPDEVLVVLGRQNIYNWEESKRGQTRFARKIIVHPTYKKSKKFGADVAIIHLKTPVSYTEYVSPVCMWMQEMDETLNGINGTVVGWGLDEKGYETNEPRLAGDLPLVPYSTCLAISDERYESFLSQHAFCAGKRDNTGPCSGDSGSGLIILTRLPNGKRRYVLRGLVSRAVLHKNIPNSCDLRQYVVYTDVAKLRPWIEDQSCILRTENTLRSELNLALQNLGGKYYYFSNWIANWTEAQAYCNSHQMHLASIESYEEFHQLYMISENVAPTLSTWLDGSNAGNSSSSHWYWASSGKEIRPAFWNYNEPNNAGGNENCLQFDYRLTERTSWNDDKCFTKLGFICELEDIC